MLDTKHYPAVGYKYINNNPQKFALELSFGAGTRNASESYKWYGERVPEFLSRKSTKKLALFPALLENKLAVARFWKTYVL